jgi:hypothetical protein
MTVTDERVDLGVDLDKAVPCALCDREARWIATDRPCGHSALLCTKHRITEAQWLAERLGTPTRVICKRCSGVVTHVDWRRP